MSFKSIPNFLDVEVADKLLEEIYNTKGDWWSKVICINNSSPKYLNPNNINDRLLLDSTQNPVFLNSLLNNAITYKFTRSTAHYETCGCYECEFRKNILMGPIKQTIEKEYKHYNMELEECFISVYYPGDFLATHTDAGKGIAFMYYLSKRWLPEYGGLLNILNPNKKSYTTVCPEYNSLVLMDVSGEAGIDHFVSEVSRLAPYPRIAISGWFSNKKGA